VKKKNDHHSEIEKALLTASLTAAKSKIPDLQKYIGTSYKLIGIPVPAQRKLFRAGYGFADLSLTEQLKIWNEVWLYSNSYEVLTHCIYFVEKNINKLDAKEVWNVTKHWVSKIDNWAHSDGLSDIFSYLLEKEPAIIYAQFEVWNKSANPWERRQTLVGLLYYSKKRKKIPAVNKISKMIIPLLEDENYFVQKGVGWALREMGNVYPEEMIKLLRKYIAMISPVAFTTAIEKLTAKEKEELKFLRKAKR
jgi:3-methyladenine DNA glycosylase AlkD